MVWKNSRFFSAFFLRSKLDLFLYGADRLLNLPEMRAGERKAGVRQAAPGICSRLKRVQLAIFRESVYNKKKIKKTKNKGDPP